MKEEEKRKIYEFCIEKSSISVKQIVDLLNVSAATARRLLQEMEDEGILRRFYGGAVINEEQYSQKNRYVKTFLQKDEKNRIARLAASLVEPKDVIYIDGESTTASKIIDYISVRDCTVVTIGVQNIIRLGERNIRCYSTGGYFDRTTSVLIDNDTIQNLKKLTFTKAFVGCTGMHEKAGFTTSTEKGAINKAVLEAAINPFVVVDSSKFNTVSSYKMADISYPFVITDQYPENFNCKLLRKLYIAK